jgi:hypothetical protein
MRSTVNRKQRQANRTPLSSATTLHYFPHTSPLLGIWKNVLANHLAHLKMLQTEVLDKSNTYAYFLSRANLCTNSPVLRKTINNNPSFMKVWVKIKYALRYKCGLPVPNVMKTCRAVYNSIRGQTDECTRRFRNTFMLLNPCEGRTIVS